VPLVDTYRRLASICADLRVRVLDDPAEPLGDTWLTMADIAAQADALAAAIDGAAARILATHGRTARPDVACSRLLHHYLWSVGLLISGPWYLTDTVPLLTPDRLWTDPATGDLALAPGSCATAPDSGPAAVRTAVADFVGPLLQAVRPRLRRGAHALWGMAGDDLVSAVWYLGRQLAEEERGVRLAEELLPGGGDAGQFRCGADFRELRGAAGRTYLTRTRTGCCLYYTLQPTDACVTCPRLTDDDRLHRLETAAG
jgi:hypothetical protein